MSSDYSGFSTLDYRIYRMTDEEDSCQKRRRSDRKTKITAGRINLTILQKRLYLLDLQLSIFNMHM